MSAEMPPQWDERTSGPSSQVRADVTPELLVCTAAVRGGLVDGCTCSMLLGPEERHPLASTDERSRQLDEAQFTVWEGPGPEALERGVPRLVADVSDAAHWPLLTSALAGTSVRGLVALPLQTSVGRIGLFTAHRLAPGHFSAPDVAALVAFADALAALALARVDASRDGPLTRPQIGAALDLVTQHFGRDRADSLSAMRSYAFRVGRSLVRVAADLMSGAVVPEDLRDGMG